MIHASIKPSVVLVHGIWEDGSIFRKVIPGLQAAGHEVMSVQCSLDTFDGDVAAVTRAFDRVPSPIILVGHSHGGQVITAAGNDDRVAGLVYVTAYATDVGETQQSQSERFPPTDIDAHIQIADGRIWLLPSGIGYLADDITSEEQQTLLAVQNPPAPAAVNATVARAAWKSKPSWYIVGKHDRTIQPDLERFFAKRMGATTFEVESSHLVMLSQPDVVVDVILKASAALTPPIHR
jgi:pimeloyl-ACP methyl ester carboxylesterase